MNRLGRHSGSGNNCSSFWRSKLLKETPASFWEEYNMKVGDVSRLKNARVTLLEGSVKSVIKTRTGAKLAIKIARVGEDYPTVEALDQIVKNEDSWEEMGTNEMNEYDLKSDSELTRNQKKDCRS
ncbi:MAG TPA: hypothetical protein VF884_08410 [Nitrososphaeraceae archaeon]